MSVKFWVILCTKCLRKGMKKKELKRRNRTGMGERAGMDTGVRTKK